MGVFIAIVSKFHTLFITIVLPLYDYMNPSFTDTRIYTQKTMQLFIRSICLLIFGLYSCSTQPNPIVDTQLTDSLLTHYTKSSFDKQIGEELRFWKSRVDSNPDAYTPLVQYAGTLIQRFHSFGNMADLLVADSILNTLNKAFQETDAGLLRSLAALNITRHRFKAADACVQKALTIGSEKYASTLLFFDTRFELGFYTSAQKALHTCRSTNDYGYLFRLAKWKHFKGETDSAAFYMQKAALLAGASLYLKQTAQSNLADLYLHEGKLEKAGELYIDNLLQNSSDFHSWQGVARLMLMHDNDYERAEKIFRFIGSNNQLPDALYNLVWVAEQKQDSFLAKKRAADFVSRATDSSYGGMYHKYLIELYTGILNDPFKAVAISEKEVNNRATPQTYAWWVWSLHKAGADAKAMELYKTYVSGKPLEALELFWMGKMMKDLGKQYNAVEFFKAADKNRFDLSPGKQLELKALL